MLSFRAPSPATGGFSGSGKRSNEFFFDRPIDAYVDDAARLFPNKTAVVDRFGRLAWRDVAELSARLAQSLRDLGIGVGDRVAVQIPNWHHVLLLEYALSRIGAVCVPLPAIYRQHELRFMLRLTRPVMVVVPEMFRDFDHVAMIDELAAEVPGLVHRVAIANDVRPGWLRFADLLKASPSGEPSRTDPNAVTEIVFTSGTTGEPKGVMHSANTNLCPVFNLIREQRLTEREVVLMASTFGHQTGFVYGGQLPAVLGATVVLLDRWSGPAGAELVQREQVTWTMGATPFLQDLVDTDADLGSLRTFLCSGAPIPQSLLGRARERMSARIASGWGMTEVGLVTLTRASDADERVFGSDGVALPGMEVRVVQEDGAEAERGEPGELLARGPSMFLGYYERPEMTQSGFTADGFFRSGDQARQDQSGYLRIVGRTKDIIIRGGENIPVVEVENLLHRHPVVAQAAVVAVPDPRLQERACAVVVLRPGASFSFAEMNEHLAGSKIARNYMPEFLIQLDAMPMTPSGKIQKYVLRQMVLERLNRKPSR